MMSCWQKHKVLYEKAPHIYTIHRVEVLELLNCPSVWSGQVWASYIFQMNLGDDTAVAQRTHSLIAMKTYRVHNRLTEK